MSRENYREIENLLLRVYLKSGKPSHAMRLIEHGFIRNSWHLNMLKDRERLNFYESIIRRSVEGKVVLDLGTGSGILSHLALQHGAKKVFSVECDPSFQEIYTHLMAKPLEEGRAVLLKKDALELKLDDFQGLVPDVIVHEIFGATIFEENVIAVMEALKKNNVLSKSTVLLPSSISLYGQLISLEGEQDLEDFSGYSLSLLRGLSALVPSALTRHDRHRIHELSAPELILKTSMMEMGSEKEFSLHFTPKGPATHVRLWMKLIHDDFQLSTCVLKTDSHWGNYAFPLLSQTSSSNVLVKFSVRNGRLQHISTV